MFGRVQEKEKKQHSIQIAKAFGILYLAEEFPAVRLA